MTRAVTAEATFGFSCYEGEFKAGIFHGRHIGVVETVEDAEAWIEGDESITPLKVYGGGDDA